MVEFHSDKFTVQVETGIDPAEDWLDTVGCLIDVLENQDEELVEHRKNRKVLRLLRSMMPNLSEVKKMTKQN